MFPRDFWLYLASRFCSAAAMMMLRAAIQAPAFTTGPARCGWVIAAADVASVYAVQAGLIAASLVALALMGTRRRAAAGGVVSLAAIREGLRFVRRNPVVLGCMTLDMFAVIFGGAAALLPSTRPRSCASARGATGSSPPRSSWAR